MDNLRLCLSLYACEPNRGSEPGVGWAWALGMAKRHRTWVLTRANNREAIVAEFDRLAVPESDRPHFVWVDLPKWAQRLKKCGVIPVSIYYLFWQFAARHAWDRLGIDVDVIHHITFCSYVVPGVWWKRREKVVLGPLGGTAVCARPFLQEFSPFRRIAEWMRGIGRQLWFLDPFFLRSRTSADSMLFVDANSAQRMCGSCRIVSTLVDVAVPSQLSDVSFDEPCSRLRQFVWAGTLAGHKAGGLALQSFARAFKNVSNPPKFLLFGKGPDRKRLEHLAQRLGISKSVVFLGVVPQEILWKHIRQSLGFVFTSVRDTCGSVSVEALACGTPLVCFKHQGVGEIVDETCGIAVQSRSYDEAVFDFASALRCLADNPVLVARLGTAGRERALKRFAWESKFDVADKIYRKLVQLGDSGNEV